MRGLRVLRISRGQVAAGRSKKSGSNWAHAQAYEPGEMPAAIISCLQEAGWAGRGGVEIWLDRSLVQLRLLQDVPPISAKDLQRLVDNHRERFFRHQDEPALVRAVWTKGRPPERLARAALVTVGLLDALDAAVTEADSAVSALRVLDADGCAIPDLVFRTAAMRERREGRHRRAARFGVAAGVVTWSFAAGSYWFGLREDINYLDRSLAELQTPLAQIADIEKRVTAFRPVADAMQRQGERDHWLSVLIATLGEALPDSAHIVTLRAERAGAVELDIRAPDALSAFKAITEVVGPEGRMMEGPVTEEHQGRTLERFSLAFEDPR